ncbi:MAG: RimK family alpha-L-glutamate ligase [Rhodospirillales bacterium]|jgi:RimK family alpha-L-glutamate ligase|nr:RimK family alpha-L-glutamate ligase [Rhodospirillales bacterium]
MRPPIPQRARKGGGDISEHAKSLRILIFADQADWHVRALTDGFAAAGAEAAAVSLRRCGLRMMEEGARFLLPEPCAAPPDLAFVKTIAAGSFEEVTLRLGILHGLEAAGSAVVNSAPAIERCVDKAQTSLRLALAGLPTPPAWCVQSREAAAALVASEAAHGHELVLKPLFGAQGRGLLRLSDPAAVPEPEAVDGIWYLQRFVPPAEATFRDCRVLVSAGRAVAAMLREHEGWITNVHQGARCVGIPAEGRVAELAIAAAGAVGAYHAGVDLIRGPDGDWRILEVNSMPAWKGLQSVTPFPIAPILAADALALARRAAPVS